MKQKKEIKGKKKKGKDTDVDGEQSDEEGEKSEDWTKEQTKRKDDIQEKIDNVYLENNIKNSIK